MERSIDRGPSFYLCQAIYESGTYLADGSMIYRQVTTFYLSSIPVHQGITRAHYLTPDRAASPCIEVGTGTVRPMSDFGRLLETEIPRLRRYARALTRDATRADDLVQSCLTRALAKKHLWQPGTDLRAWLFTILHNQHVNDVRRSLREGVSVAVEDVAPILTVQPNVAASLQLRDLEAALTRLPEEQQQVILLVGLEGLRYEEVATILGVPIGTIRSRLSRGRDSLRCLMELGEEAPQSAAAAAPRSATRRSAPKPRPPATGTRQAA